MILNLLIQLGLTLQYKSNAGEDANLPLFEIKDLLFQKSVRISSGKSTTV